MTFSDWSELTDANETRYDPRPALAMTGTEDADEGFTELWERVHHQGTLGTAAYAVLPALIAIIEKATLPDWRAYGLIATIEECREIDTNPPVPEWLEGAYTRAIQDVIGPAIEHLRISNGDLEVRSIIAVLAHAKGQPTIGTFALWTEDERLEVVR